MKRSDPYYRTAATWAPASSGLGADLAESAVTGGLLAGAIITLDYTILGAWCDYGSMAFVVLGCVTLAWLRLRWVRVRAGNVQNFAHSDIDDPSPAERVLLLRTSRRPPEADDSPTLFEQFITGAALDSTLERWEPEIGRNTYQAWRDMLIDAGVASWRSPVNKRLGWRLTATADEVLERLAE